MESIDKMLKYAKLACLLVICGLLLFTLIILIEATRELSPAGLIAVISGK
jgi:hypothetical protein